MTDASHNEAVTSESDKTTTLVHDTLPATEAELLQAASSTGGESWSVTGAIRSSFGFLLRTDRETHGYVPFLLWITLLFGGFWFPATPFLEHVFNDKDAPINHMFGTTTQSESGAKLRISQGRTALFLPVSLVFWSWTNLALLCVMASAMGEVNRAAEQARKQGETGGMPDPDYRTACTRAFFVYLFVLLNELTIAGTLSSSAAGDSYQRVAILASATCFLASYRPDFFRGLVSKFATSQEEEGDGDDPPADDPAGKQDRPADRVNQQPEDEPGYDDHRKREFTTAGAANE